MDEEKIIDDVIDFVSQYTEILDVKLSIEDKKIVNLSVKVMDTDFDYLKVTKMLSKLLKVKYDNYKFVIKIFPLSSKVLPLMKEYGLKSEFVKSLYHLSFDEAFNTFLKKQSPEDFDLKDIFFTKPMKLSFMGMEDFVSEKEACNDYIDYLNEAYLLIGKAKLMETMVRFNLFKLYGSKLLRMGTVFIIKLWRFNYDKIMWNLNLQFADTIKDKKKFLDFINSLELKTIDYDSNTKISFYLINKDILIDLLVGAATYMEALVTSMIQKMILLDPSKFYNYLLKRFVPITSENKISITYYLTLAGAVAVDDIEFDQIGDSILGRFKINRSEIKVDYTGKNKIYLSALDRAYARILRKRKSE
jgi:hypothetical protein